MFEIMNSVLDTYNMSVLDSNFYFDSKTDLIFILHLGLNCLKGTGSWLTTKGLCL